MRLLLPSSRRAAKRRRNSGYNATLSLRERPRTSHLKWRKARYPLRAPARWNKPLNPTYASTNEELAGLGSLVNARLKGRRQTSTGRAGFRYLVHPRQRTRDSRRDVPVLPMQWRSSERPYHALGRVDLDPVMRLWKTELALTRHMAERIWLRNDVERIALLHGKIVPLTGISRQSPVLPGTGLRIRPEAWRKLKRKRWKSYKMPGHKMYKGLTGVPYAEVDYVTGCVLVRHRPYSGQVLGPARWK